MPPKMPDQSLLGQVADLRRRLEALERTSGRTTTRGPSGITIRDAAGNPRVRIGGLGVDGGEAESVADYGIEVLTSGGRTVFRVGGAGVTAPPYRPPLIHGGGTPISTDPAGAFRPGTTSSSYTEIWRCDLYTIGPNIDYDLIVYPNGQTMAWRIRVAEQGGGTFQTTVEETGVTVNAQKFGTFTVPASALLPGTGTDPVGRWITMRIDARRTAGTSSTVDIGMLGVSVVA